MDSPSKRTEESSKTTTYATSFPIIFPNDLQEDFWSASSMILEEQTMEGVQNVRPATTDEMYVPFCGNFQPINVYDDLMAKLCRDNDIFELAGNEPVPLDHISLEVFKIVEGLEHSVTEHTTSINNTQLTSNPSKEVNNSTPPVVSEAPTSFKGGVIDSDPQGPPGVEASFGKSMFPNTTGLLPNRSSSSHQQLQRTGISTQDRPAKMPRRSQRLFWPHAPSLKDFSNFVDAWEGSLVGKIHSYNEFLTQAKAVRKPTSPITLTAQWWKRLEIILFLPASAVNKTMKIYSGPIDYVFFHINESNNLDLYDYLKSKKLCAKIELPSQTLILSVTESKYHYLGAIFSGGTVFAEHF